LAITGVTLRGCPRSISCGRMRLNALLLCREHQCLRTLSAGLGELGIEPDVCASAPDALELLAQRYFSALVVDFDLHTPDLRFTGENGATIVEPGAFDVVISRFGVMFFADPPAAFANISSAVRSGGRLAMLVWQPLAANEWITAMRGALAVGRDLPVPPPGVPSPFGLADKGFASGVLTAAGFTDVAFEDSEQPFRVGSDADDAYGFVAGLQPVLMLLADLDEAAKAQALDNLRTVVAAHDMADGVVFGSAAWVVTARKP